MHCTYITTHPAGFFYIGKSQPNLIELGYQGSGVRLHCAFMDPNYSKDKWITKIVQTFETEAEAYAHEGELCPLTMLTNPFCMNDTPGGRAMYRGSAHGRILKSAKAAIRKEKEIIKKAKLKAQKEKLKTKQLLLKNAKKKLP